MKRSLIITPALIYYISSMALCKICISYITVSYAGDTTPRIWKVVPHLKQQSKAILQHSSMSNNDRDQR
jgi:hypothetical protein